jgi:hypothetical protein
MVFCRSLWLPLIPLCVTTVTVGGTAAPGFSGVSAWEITGIGSAATFAAPTPDHFVELLKGICSALLPVGINWLYVRRVNPEQNTLVNIFRNSIFSNIRNLLICS